MYYGVEFLPDTIALALSFGGLYFYEKWREKAPRNNLYLGLLFFSLAVLTKVSAGILLVALVSYELVTFQKGKLWNTLKALLPWSLPFVLTLIWVQYAAWYNAQFNNVYFLLDTVPYWTLTEAQITGVKTGFMETWYNELLAYKSLWLLTLPFFAFGLLWYKKLQKEDGSTSGLCLYYCDFCFYCFLNDLDTMIITSFAFMVFLPLLLMYGISIIKVLFKNKLALLLFLLASVPFVAANVSTAQVTAETRSHTWNYYNKLDNNLALIDDWLNENGVTKEVPVLSVYDPSPNVSLYYMNRKGLVKYLPSRIDRRVCSAR